MALSDELISSFVKVTNDTKKEKTETTVLGTVVKQGNKEYVKIDGSELLTPINSTTIIRHGDRVTVLIKDHSATVTGNISSPSASDSDVQDAIGQVTEMGSKITEFEIAIGDKVSVKEFDAVKGRIDNLTADNVNIKEKLNAQEAEIDDLTADNVTINEQLTAQNATIENLETNKLDADIADLKFATIEELEATDAHINNLEVNYGEFKELATNEFEAIDANIKNLDTQYANIDFSNIGKAAMEYFYANSGLIKDVVIGDATISGNLVGVTISGDLIEGNTVVADKLVIKGEDGLYYKLNTNGITTEAEQTDYNSLNGQIIKAKSVTATKIDVEDLVAFDATIGGFNITENSIYSGFKESVDNTTRGIYLDNDGQLAIGDSDNYIKYYKDTDGSYKLQISAKSISIGTGNKSIEETIEELKDEITTVLRIDSSRGTVFKNNAVSTVLNVAIYRGSKRITDITALKQEMGESAYLEWSWQKMGEDTFGTILATDSRISNDGFTFALSPEDVDTKVTFICQLITD